MKIALSIVLAGILIGGAILFSGPSAPTAGTITDHNVSIVDGTQIIEVSAKGGYFPRKSLAQAGMPTILRLKTSSTYDCSSAVRIPSMGISRFLPPTGATDIDLGSPQEGALRGMCGMGMYSFEIAFQK